MSPYDFTTPAGILAWVDAIAAQRQHGFNSPEGYLDACHWAGQLALAMRLSHLLKQPVLAVKCGRAAQLYRENMLLRALVSASEEDLNP